MRTAYIAGKIAGLPKAQVKNKFNIIARKLRGMGYHVVKPLAVSDESDTDDQPTRTDIKKLVECDELHMLPDWQESRSAQLERDIAIRLGMDVVYH
jgi:hypothetical protein